jgi:hypothetical protein
LSLICLCIAETKFEKLKDLQTRSRVLDFTDSDIQSYTTQSSNYSIILLFATTNPQIPGVEIAKQATKYFSSMADQFYDQLGPEGYNSKAFLSNPVFFARCELEKCRDTFQEGSKKGWAVVPKIFHVPPRPNKGGLDLHRWADMDRQPIDRDAGQMADWVRDKTKFNFVVHVPFLIRHGGTILTVAAALALFYLLWTRLKDVAQSRKFWFAISMGIFAFSMAGIVYNSIHNPPFSHYNPNTKQQMYIYPSARQQFVVEGYIIAGILTGMGLLVVSLVEVVPKFEDDNHKRVSFVLISALFFFLYQNLMAIFRMKYGWYPF